MEYGNVNVDQRDASNCASVHGLLVNVWSSTQTGKCGIVSAGKLADIQS